MNKRGFMILLASAVVTLCSCGLQPSVKGDDLINKARKDYKSLNSAKVIITNEDTGEAEQTFVFKYDEKDILTYSYEGVNGEDVYAQYNNGMESFSYEKGEYTYNQKGDKDFIAYTRDVTHPQADEGLIIFQPSAVDGAELTTENGITHVHHNYNVDKLKVENTSAFSTDYYFDSENNLLYFVESSTVKVDGKNKNYKYRVDITEKNSVDKVENTVEKYKK